MAACAAEKGRNKMKKKIALLCIIGMMCSMAACGGTPAATESTTTAATTTTTAADTTAADTTSAADTTTAADTTAADTTTEADTTTTAADTTAAPETTTQTAAYADVSGVALSGEPVDGYFVSEAQLEEILGNSVYNEGNLARLAKVIKKAQDGGEVNISYIGGSITQGSSAGDNLCYAYLTTKWFEETFPNATINYNRAGIGATGSYIGVHRVDDDVLSKNPDLVFVEYSVNDTTEATERNKNSYDSLLRKIWNHSTNPAVVCICMTQENGTSFQEEHAAIAKSYDLPVITYKNAILGAINSGMFVWDTISDDNIHPNVPGHDLLSKLITNYLRDVMAKLGSIDTSAESSFSSAATGDIYANAARLNYINSTPDEIVGFRGKDTAFGNINGVWRVTSGADGKFEDDAVIKYTVTARNIGVFYGMQINGGGKFDVYIDGEKVKTISGDFAGGWGNYVEAAEIASYDTASEHVVEIKPVDSDKKTAVIISALAVS